MASGTSNSNSPICVVIPMKDPKDAKTRLGDTLPQKARAALARTLFRHSLRVLRSLDADLHIAVVTNSPDVREITLPFRVAHIPDPGAGLNAAVEAGAAYAVHHRFQSLCVLPGDLADPAPDDLEALFVHAGSQATAIIVPSHDGGTNALLISPPEALAFSYGPQSSLAHQEAAEQAGLSCLIKPLPSLLYDVDRSTDLNARLIRGLDRSLGAIA